MVKQEDMRNAVARIYIAERHKDPHSVFADWLRTDRDSAKIAAYRFIYSVPFVQGLISGTNRRR